MDNSVQVCNCFFGGIHTVIADFLGKEEDIEVRTVTLDDEECGLADEVLANTDVLIWWGHMRHMLVPDEIAQRVQKAVLSGMGMIFYFQPGHESFPTFYNKDIQTVIKNAVRFTCPVAPRVKLDCPHLTNA